MMDQQNGPNAMVLESSSCSSNDCSINGNLFLHQQNNNRTTTNANLNPTPTTNDQGQDLLIKQQFDNYSPTLANSNIDMLDQNRNHQLNLQHPIYKVPNSNLLLDPNLIPVFSNKGKTLTLKSVLIDFLAKFRALESIPLDQPNSAYVQEFIALKELSENLKKDKANFAYGECEYNLRKNRYTDILPFNHTRVTLKDLPQIPGSDYINANYIEGMSGTREAYIACQGPLPSTLVDFWRMIWETNVSIIIMACNEHESGQLKCKIYWPEQLYGIQIYGNIEVSLIREKELCSDYLIRKFSVKLLGEPSKTSPADSNNCERLFDDKARYNLSRPVIEERTICQFHYTTWPDHGVPGSVQPILELVKLLRQVQPSDDKPIVVHCSAGCGRTGTICCIDYVFGLLHRGKINPDFNMFRIISDMRRQRMAMVQTLDQYIFCHRAVASLFVQQLQLIDSHVYENLPDEYTSDDSDTDSDYDSGPVFI